MTRLLALLCVLLCPALAWAQTTWSINPTTGTVILDNVTITDPLMELGVTVDLQLDKQATGGAAQCLQVGSTGLVTKTGSACGGTGSSPGGADTNVQYNSSGTFAGDASFTFASGSKKVTLFDLIISDQATGGAAQCLQIDTSGNVTKTGSACSTSAGTVTHTGGLTLHAPIIGNGTADIKATAVLTNGQMLIGSTGADPVPAAIGSSTLTITTGAGSLSLDTASIATHQLVVARGAGPYVGLGTLGTTTTVLHGNAAGDPTFGSVNASTDMTGILPVPNGGLGLASGTTGGIPYFTSATTISSSAALVNHAVVAGGGSAQPPHTITSTPTSGLVLTAQGAGADPIWAATGGPGSTTGAAQFNATSTVFGGEPTVLYAAAFGFSTGASGATNRAALQSAINALPASGGRVIMPAGGFALDSTAITITTPMILEGTNVGNNVGTQLTTAGATNDVFSVNVAGSVTFQHFGVTNGVTRTGGAYIHFVTTDNARSVINDLILVGCLTCLDMEAANGWVIKNSYILIRQNTNAIGIFAHSTIADNGGFLVENNIFDGGTNLGTAIKVTSGGGLIIKNNGFLNHAAHVIFDWTPVVDSSEFKVIGNTFDCQGSPAPNYGILFGTEVGGGTVHGVTIDSNSFIGCAVAGIGSAAASKWENIAIVGNNFDVPNSAIGIDSHLGAAIVSGNIFRGEGAGSFGVAIQTDAISHYVSGNQFYGTWSATTTNGSGTSVVGFTGTKTVRASGGASDCTLIYTQGALTGGSC